MLQCPPYTQDGVVLSSERVGDVGLAHRHVPPFGEAPVKAVGNRPTSRLQHEGFEADEFLANPLGLGMGTEAPNGVTDSTCPQCGRRGSHPHRAWMIRHIQAHQWHSHSIQLRIAPSVGSVITRRSAVETAYR